MDANIINSIYGCSRDFLISLNKKYKRSFPNYSPFDARMAVLLGQRGVGKTTTLIQYLLAYSHNKPDSEKILYLPVDHVLIVDTPLFEIAKYFHDHGGEVICFDEIHKYSDWSRELKSIFDSFPKLKIIASGSSALEIYRGSHDLSRRAISYTLHGLSFREYLELSFNISLPVFSLDDIMKNHVTLSREIIRTLEPINKKVLSCFKHYLQFGFYPYFLEYEVNLRLYHISLEQSVHTSIESDLTAIHPSLSGSSIKNIKKLLSHIARLVPDKPDLAKLKKSLELSDDRTLKNYLKYLEDAHIIRALCKEGKSLNNLDKPEKIYLNNPNLIYAFGKKNPDLGNIRETFFASAVSSNYELFYSANGDFAFENYIFEVGGQNKSFNQIKDNFDAYLAIDGIEYGHDHKIPLWLFGFLY